MTKPLKDSKQLCAMTWLALKKITTISVKTSASFKMVCLKKLELSWILFFSKSLHLILQVLLLVPLKKCIKGPLLSLLCYHSDFSYKNLLTCTFSIVAQLIFLFYEDIYLEILVNFQFLPVEFPSESLEIFKYYVLSTILA